MSVSQPADQIERLHALYCELSGRGLGFLNWTFENGWKEWLKFNRPPFTEGDLRLVITTIQAGIKTGKRKPGALKFWNLIQQPDKFADELAEARSLAVAASRAPKRDTERDKMLRATGREPESQPSTARSVGELIDGMTVPEYLAKWRQQQR